MSVVVVDGTGVGYGKLWKGGGKWLGSLPNVNPLPNSFSQSTVPPHHQLHHPPTLPPSSFPTSLTPFLPLYLYILPLTPLHNPNLIHTPTPPICTLPIPTPNCTTITSHPTTPPIYFTPLNSAHQPMLPTLHLLSLPSPSTLT